MKRILTTAAVIGWVVLIFYFSAQTADESTGVSLWAGRRVCEWVIPGFNEWPAQKQYDYAETIDFTVRKTAHATEYLLLAVLVAGMLGSYGIKGRKRLLLAFILSAFYAVTDEVHQLFVPGRSGQISDVLLDSCGALTGCAAFWCVSRLYRRLRLRWERRERVTGSRKED